MIVIEPQPDWQRVRFSVDLELSDEQMADLEDEVDSDDSGIISADEVAAYENASQYVRNDYHALGDMKMGLDYEPSTRVLFRTGLAGFEGDVGGIRKRVVTEHRDHHFNVAGDTYHRIEGGNNTSAGYIVIELVIIRAPDGWRITSVNGTERNATTLQLPGFDVKSHYTIGFTHFGEAAVSEEPEDKRDVYVVPGPSLALVVMVGAACLVAVRRKAG